MNYDDAIEILGIEESDEIDMIILKKHYKLMALQHHPDKNREPDACERFQEIQEAYEFIKLRLELEDDFIVEEDEDNGIYSNILFSFINAVNQSRDSIQMKLVNLIFKKIFSSCEDKAMKMIENIDRNILKKIYEIVLKYKSVLHITDNFLKGMEHIINNKMECDECIILHPLLSDLFENNIYKLSVKSNLYIIPLWHHELIYDNSGSDLYVKCFPILSDNMVLDDNNNLHIQLSYKIDEIWNKDMIEIELGGKTIYFTVADLKIMKKQKICLKYQGISISNTENIYDISNKSDIILHIELENAR